MLILKTPHLTPNKKSWQARAKKFSWFSVKAKIFPFPVNSYKMLKSNIMLKARKATPTTRNNQSIVGYPPAQKIECKMPFFSFAVSIIYFF